MNAVAGRRRLSLLVWSVIALTALMLAAWLAGAFDGWRGRDGTDRRASLYAGAFEVCNRPTASIPPGFDYPQPAGAVAGWVAQGPPGEARAREHGWFLWAGLNSPTDAGPVWRTWCTSTQVFPPAAAGTGANRASGRFLSLGARRRAVGGEAQGGEDPIRFPVSPVYTLPPQVLTGLPERCLLPGASPAALADGPTLESNGDIMVAGVIYNDAAYNSIVGRGLNTSQTLEGMLPPPGQQQPNWPRLDPNSVVLKPMMWPVPQTGSWALPVWDNATSDGGAYTGFEIQSQWPRAVAVTAEPQASGTRNVSLLLNGGVTNNGAVLGPNAYQNAPVHSVDEFYGFRPDLGSMDPCDLAILNASSYWAYNRPFQQGDYLVVVAMHIMTREQTDWTFQSVWWHDRPNAGPYSLNRPPSLPPGIWSNYLMTSTYGFAGPPGPGGEAQWPIAYNPYIELAADHPIRTNCMNCHHRAAVPGEPPPPAPPWPVGSYEAQRLMCGPPVPDALDVYAQDNAIFNSLLLVDSIWSISDRVPVSRSGRAAAGPWPDARAASCPPAAAAGTPRRSPG